MLRQGAKIRLVLKESPKQSKRKDIHIEGKIDSIYSSYVIVNTKNYKICINIVDFNTGHAVFY